MNYSSIGKPPADSLHYYKLMTANDSFKNVLMHLILKYLLFIYILHL